jgi:predicted glycosyl hydrolase (DUF1957 family)
MTGPDLEYYGKLIFGDFWIMPMATALKVHRDTVSRAASGQKGYYVPEHAKPVIVRLLRNRIKTCKKELKELDRTL